MENIKDLRAELLSVLTKVTNGEIEPKVAKEIANISGKVIATATLQLKYNMIPNPRAIIDFLETDDGAAND